MEILALHPGALGDIILSLPALNLLKKHLAGSRLSLAGNSDFLAIVPASCAERRLSLAILPLQRLYGSDPLPRSDIEFWTSFDRIVSWTGLGDPRFVGNLRAVHPEALVAAWRPGPGETRHVSRIFADSLSRWLLPPETLDPVDLRPGAVAACQAKQWLAENLREPDAPTAALQPGGGSAAKRWPLTHFAQVAQRLLQSGIRNLLVIEGPAEPGLGTTLKDALPSASIAIAKCLPLERLAAILSLSRPYVGNDSGISHLAAALGLPCAVIFGPTSPSQWAPLGPRVTVFRDTSGCRACAESRPDGHRCLENISPDDVLRVLDAVY